MVGLAGIRSALRTPAAPPGEWLSCSFLSVCRRKSASTGPRVPCAAGSPVGVVRTADALAPPLDWGPSILISSPD